MVFWSAITRSSRSLRGPCTTLQRCSQSIFGLDGRALHLPDRDSGRKAEIKIFLVSLVPPLHLGGWQLQRVKRFAAYAGRENGSVCPAFSKTHVRADPRRRLHGERARQPSGTARNSEGVTTENYVEYRCRAIRPYDGGTMWITRPLIRGTASASVTGPAGPENTGTGDRGTSQPYSDVATTRWR